MSEKTIHERRLKISGAYITGTHPYSFRCGEPGLITGVKIVDNGHGEPHPCYEVTYADGFIDYTSIEGDLTYKIHSNGEDND